MDSFTDRSSCGIPRILRPEGEKISGCIEDVPRTECRNCKPPRRGIGVFVPQIRDSDIRVILLRFIVSSH